MDTKELVIPAGFVSVALPKGYEVEYSSVFIDGMTYDDFAELIITDSIITIADTLPVDLRITVKKKKKFLGIF